MKSTWTRPDSVQQEDQFSNGRVVVRSATRRVATHRWSFETANGTPRTTTSPLSRYSFHGTATHQRYRLGAVLGIGNYGTVYHAVDVTTGTEWACKVVSGAAARELQLKEIDLLKQIDHPCVVRYREHFTIGDKLHMITELVHGKGLDAAIRERGSYAEEDARMVTIQILEALEYLASKGIAHRDIKAGNIMLINNNEHTKIKIIDFGFGGQLTESQRHFTRSCGTPTHVAPEIVSEFGPKYGTTCDVWSAGVTLYKLLSGADAFEAGDLTSLVHKVRDGEVWFDDPVWELVSPEAQDLVNTLLNVDPSKRPTATAALKHKWLKDA